MWPTAAAVEVDSVSSVSASACHSSGSIGVSSSELALVYGKQKFRQHKMRHDILLGADKFSNKYHLLIQSALKRGVVSLRLDFKKCYLNAGVKAEFVF